MKGKVTSKPLLVRIIHVRVHVTGHKQKERVRISD